MTKNAMSSEKDSARSVVLEMGQRSGLYLEMCEFLGDVYTERLCSIFGGRRVYLSTAPSNKVVRYLGVEVALRLVKTYGRGYMYIPMAGIKRRGFRVDDNEIVKALREGLSTNIVVDRLCVSRHRVEKVRRRYGLHGKAGNPGYCRSKIV